MSTPRVLLTLADLPGVDGGKRLRAASVLHALSQLAHVDAVVLLPDEACTSPDLPFSSLSVPEVVSLPLRSRPRALARLVRRRLPWQIAVRDYSRAVRLVDTWSRDPYDLVWFGATDHAISLAGHIAARRTVVDHDDIETTKILAQLRLPPAPGLAGRLKRVQRRVELPLWARMQRLTLEQHDVVVVCSDLDRGRLGEGRIEVVPNTYRDPGLGLRQPSMPPIVLFVGTWSYAPNVDAAVFATREVLPRLRARIGSVRLRLVGREPQALTSLKGLPGVEIVGPVADMARELQHASVALVPVRFGGGTRLKVIEALAWGLPLASTNLGCEGLGVVNGEHGLLADDAPGLADACARLIQDTDLMARITDAGRRLYLHNYQPAAADEAVRNVVTPLLRR